MAFIILSVESHSNYTLGLSNKDKCSEGEIVDKVIINFGSGDIELSKSLKTYVNNGRLTSPQINTWIIDNGLINAVNPYKLIFEVFKSNNTHTFKIYPFQANKLK